MNAAAAGVEAWAEDVDRRHASRLFVQKLNVKEELEAHLAAALRELGYVRQASSRPQAWPDPEGREHPVQEVWSGPKGALGLTRLDGGGVLGYTRGPEADNDLRKVMSRYAERVMAASFDTLDSGTFEVDTDDDGALPVKTKLQPGKELQLEAEVINEARDGRYLGAIARVNRLFGEPEKHYVRPGTHEKRQPQHLNPRTQPAPSRAAPKPPQKVKVRRRQ